MNVERREWIAEDRATATAASLGADPLLAVLRMLDDGAIHDRIIENEGAFLVVRRLASTPQGVRVEAIVVAKRPYEAWYQAQAAG